MNLKFNKTEVYSIVIKDIPRDTMFDMQSFGVWSFVWADDTKQRGTVYLTEMTRYDTIGLTKYFENKTGII